MPWDRKKDDERARRWIVKLAMVLTNLRCIAQTWRDKNENGGSTIGFSVTQPESPRRAIEVLGHLAIGHALLTGRNSITMEDIPIVVKTVLSTAHLDKVGLMFFLISNNGVATTEEIQKFLKVTRPTAHKNMTELEVTGLVDSEKEEVSGSSSSPPHGRKSIRLKEKFNWMLGEEFQKLREGFEPVDNRGFLNEDAEPCKAKKTPYTTNNNPFSLEQISIFWRVFSELEDVERRSNPGMEMDKTTIQEKTLQDGLVSTGKFSQSDATMIIENMKREEFGIEQVDGWDTIRRKTKPKP
jgi:predicted transcriptional regulator